MKSFLNNLFSSHKKYKGSFCKHLDPMCLVLSFLDSSEIIRLQGLSKVFYNKIIGRVVHDVYIIETQKYYHYTNKASNEQLWELKLKRMNDPNPWRKVELPKCKNYPTSQTECIVDKNQRIILHKKKGLDTSSTIICLKT